MNQDQIMRRQHLYQRDASSKAMKKDIHPNYVDCSVSCSCGNKFTTRATVPVLTTDICNACHPFFTGNDKILDTTGRVERFQKRFNWKTQTT